MDMAEQLRRFNEDRARLYGRPPSPESRLPIPRTGVGGDIDPPETDDDR